MIRPNYFSKWRLILTLPLMLLICSCQTLGPEYEEPDVQWLNDWQSSSQSDSGDTIEDLQGVHSWWLQFDDPVLVSLIESARVDNLTLRIAALRILESRAVQGIAGSTLYPQVQEITAATDSVTTQQDGSGSLDQVVTQAQGLVGWEIDFWGRFQRAIETADAAFFASVSRQRDLQVLITAQIANLYFSYRVTESRLVITRNNAAIQKRSFDITEERFIEGEESELDFQQARTQYLATLSVIPQLELSLRTTRNALCVLMGLPPGPIPELAENSFELPSVEPTTLMSFPAQILVNRPDVRVAAWQVAAQSAQIGIAEAEYYPAISLLGSLGWSRSSLDSVPESSALSVGPALRWRVFDHGAILNNIRVQNAKLQQAIESFQATVLEAANEVDNATFNVLKSNQQQSILDESVEAAWRALEIANTRYREGYSDFQRVLTAQRAYFTQVERQILNKGLHLGAVINFYKSIGGGWKSMTLEELIPEDTREKMSENLDWGDMFSAPLIDSPITNNKDLENE
ncbi:MAG: hypothetical protein CBC13_04975 [Planctomycetia bacterium TMED53]|nr:MAG: hypothetical protein CBC13_04975 [Planctomycetia bacterium TMED53]